MAKLAGTARTGDPTGTPMAWSGPPTVVSPALQNPLLVLQADHPPVLITAWSTLEVQQQLSGSLLKLAPRMLTSRRLLPALRYGRHGDDRGAADPSVLSTPVPQEPQRRAGNPSARRCRGRQLPHGRAPPGFRPASGRAIACAERSGGLGVLAPASRSVSSTCPAYGFSGGW